MRWLWVLFLTFMAAILQVSFVGSLRIGGIVPNLVLVLIVGLVVWGAASEALMAAVLAGLIMDISGAGIFGLATSSLVVISLGLVALRQLGMDGHAWPARLGLVTVATIAWWFIHIAAIGINGFIMIASWRILAIEVVVNCCIALVVTERLIHGSRKI